MTDMLEGVPDARLRALHLTTSHNISAHFSSKFTMFFPKPSLELVAKIPPWFATKQFPQRSNIPSKIMNVLTTFVNRHEAEPDYT